MKALVIREDASGGACVRLEDVPRPQPKHREVLVRVRAAALNRADLAMNAYHRDATPRAQLPIAGLEYAGEIADLGPGVENRKAGDRVMAFGTAAFAEYAVIDSRLLIPLTWPADWIEAAALPVAIETMHDAVITNGQLRPGQTVLIQGAASGVGIMGIQVAKARGAAQIIGTSRSDSKLSELENFGIDIAVNTDKSDWVELVLKATNGRGADLTIDMVSAGVANGNLAATAIGGRIVNVGRLGGFTGQFDFDLHAKRRITYVGVTFRTRTNDEVAKIIDVMTIDLLPELSANKLSMPISKVFRLEDGEAAYNFMRANAHLGKVVFRIC